MSIPSSRPKCQEEYQTERAVPNLRCSSSQQAPISRHISLEWIGLPSSRSVHSIHSHLRTKEDLDTISLEKEASSKYFQCRTATVDWLIELCNSFGLRSAVILAAVHHMDRVLCARPISRAHYQLVAMACVLIATKFEYKRPPFLLRDLCARTGIQHATVDAIKRMELLVLNHLHWDVAVSTPFTFFEYYFCSSFSATDRIRGPAGELRELALSDREAVRSHACFLVDLSVADASFLCFKPSVIVSASLAVARKLLHVSPIWPPTLKTVTQYTETAIFSCCKLMTTRYQGCFKAIHHFPCSCYSPEHPANEQGDVPAAPHSVAPDWHDPYSPPIIKH